MRQIPKTLAPIVEDLELNQPRLVTRNALAAIFSRLGTDASLDYVLNRLIEEGWLLPLKTRGVWEFAPAARAGAIDSGDPLIELRATLLKRPELKIALAAESAAWLHGLSGRLPERHVLAARKPSELPPALEGFRVVTHVTQLPFATKEGLPTWAVASLVAAMAARPGTYRDWPNVREWLPQAFAMVEPEQLLTELEHQHRAAWARLAYLASAAGQLELAESLIEDAPDGTGPYYLGRRDRKGHYDSHFGVIDSALQRTKP